MDHLPMHDVPMLVSAINFLLRDREYEDLQDICRCFDLDQKQIEELLESHGYYYDTRLNSIK